MKLIRFINGIFVTTVLLCIWWLILPEDISPAPLAMKLSLSALVILIDYKISLIKVPEWLFKALRWVVSLRKLAPYLVWEKLFDLRRADFTLLHEKSRKIYADFESKRPSLRPWRSLGRHVAWLCVAHMVLAITLSLYLSAQANPLGIALLWCCILIPFIYFSNLFGEDARLTGYAAEIITSICELIILVVPIAIFIPSTALLFSGDTLLSDDGWWYTPVITLGTGIRQIELSPSFITIVTCIAVILFNYAQLCQDMLRIVSLYPEIITEEDCDERYPLCPECHGIGGVRSFRCTCCKGRGRVSGNTK